MARGRYAALDGLRAFAVLLVFADHLNADLFPGGWIGVDLFFVISGYLITTLLLAEWRNTGDVRFGAFYTRRFLRLMPALVVLVVVAFPIALRFDVGWPLGDSLAAVTYLMDFYVPLSGNAGGFLAHTWSLAVEEQFYLLWPALLVLGLRRRWPLTGIVLGGIAASVATTVLLATSTSVWNVYRTPFPHIPELLTGVLLAFAVAREAPWLRHLRPVWVPAAALLVMAVATFVLDLEQRFLYFGGFVLLAVPLTALVGHVVMTPQGAFTRAFARRLPVWLGVRSYGFYLWHYPVLLGTSFLVQDRWITLAIAVPATLAATAVSWRLVETPFLQLKRRFESPATDVAPAGVAASA